MKRIFNKLRPKSESKLILIRQTQKQQKKWREFILELVIRVKTSERGNVFSFYEMVSPLNLMHKQINSPGKPVRQAIKRQREREGGGREPFLKPRASESVRIKQLPKGKRARRLKKKERTANLRGAQERPANRESGEARSDLGTRFAAIRREIKQKNPTNSNRGSEMYRNLRETRIHLLVGAQRGGSDQSKQNSDRSGPKQGGGKTPTQQGHQNTKPSPKTA
jgi:hypothetical protein